MRRHSSSRDRPNNRDISQAIRRNDITRRPTSNLATTRQRISSSRTIARRSQITERLNISSIILRLHPNRVTAETAVASTIRSRTTALRIRAVEPAEVRRTAAVAVIPVVLVEATIARR
jgi:hypothetical protein